MTMHQFRQMPDGTIIDTTTGENLGGKGNRGTFIFVPARQKLKESWFMFFQSACEQLALDKDLSGETFRVLMHLLSTLDFENYILIQQSEIAEKLEMKRPNVSRAIKQLLERGILVKGGRSGALTATSSTAPTAGKGASCACSRKVRNALKPVPAWLLITPTLKTSPRLEAAAILNFL